MLQQLTQLAAGEGPHISLKAEPVFDLAGFTVTNSIIYGIIVAVSMVIIGHFAAKKAGIKPAGLLTTIFELALEFIQNMLVGILGSRDKAIKYAPIFGTFFIFIVFNNLSGLLPLVGEGFTIGEGTLFRPFTADLNGTIALSIVAIIIVQYLSIKESGLGGHLKHYFTDEPWNPINFFIGVLEVFGELTRVISLSLRLFFNTALGEILIAILAFLGQNAGSFTLLPIYLFEILVALVQAYIFTVLCATYLGLAIAHGDEHHEEDAHDTSSSRSETLAVEGVS